MKVCVRVGVSVSVLEVGNVSLSGAVSVGDAWVCVVLCVSVGVRCTCVEVWCECAGV